MKFNRIQNILLFTYVLAISYISFFNAPIKTNGIRFYRSDDSLGIFKQSLFNPRLDTIRLFIIILVLTIINIALLILFRNVSLKLESILNSIKTNKRVYIIIIITILTSFLIIWGRYNNDRKFSIESKNDENSEYYIDTIPAESPSADTSAIIDNGK